MDKSLLMAVDLGTSFIKAGVYNAQSECVAISAVATKDERPKPGVFLQKGEDLFHSAVECMKTVCAQLGQRAKDIEAIAFTGQMAGFMGVDSEWNDITTWSCSLDSRYIPYVSKQMKDLKDDFLVISGTNSPQMAAKFDWFNNEFPEQAKKIRKYQMISGYMIGRLGKIPIEDATIDQTYLQWTGLADVAKRQWSDKICNVVKIELEKLPRVVQSDAVCGYLASEIAGITGLKSGIPLVSGAGDKAAGCLGAGITEPGNMIFEASSYGAVSCCVDEYRPDLTERRLDVIPAFGGKYYATNYVPGSGITLDWFVNTFVREKNEKTSAVFERLESEIADIRPGCNGLMAIGLLGGSAMPLIDSLRGMFMGFDWSHTESHFYKALLESFSYDFGLTVKQIDSIYPEYELNTVKVIGGGAKSSVWTQMNADVMGKTFQKLNREDVALWGAAILAGSAIGVFPDICETAKSHVQVLQEYKPDMEMNKTYQKYMQLYKQYTCELQTFYTRIHHLGV